MKDHKDIHKYMLPETQLTTLGLCILHYNHINQYNNFLYILNHAKDIKFIQQLRNKNDDLWSFITTFTGECHRVPGFVKENDIAYFCSLGRGADYTALLAQDIKESMPEKNIYSSTQQIQNDKVSCGTFSLMTIEHVQRMGENIINYITQQETNQIKLDNLFHYNTFEILPPEIAALSQHIGFIKRINPDDKRGMYDLHPEKESEVFDYNGNGQYMTAMKFIQKHLINDFLSNAILKRKQIYRSTINQTLHNSTPDDIRNMVKKGMGIDLIDKATFEQLSPLFPPEKGKIYPDFFYELSKLQQTNGSIICINFGLFKKTTISSNNKKHNPVDQNTTQSLLTNELESRISLIKQQYEDTISAITNGNKNIDLECLAKLKYTILILEAKNLNNVNKPAKKSIF